MTLIRAKTSWYSSILGGVEASEVWLNDDTLSLVDDSKNVTKRIKTDQIVSANLDEGFLRNGLSVTVRNRETFKINGLEQEKSKMLHLALKKRIADHRANEEKRRDEVAKRDATSLRPEIMALDQKLKDLFTTDSYIRKSEAIQVFRAVKELTRRCDDRMIRLLSKKTAAALNRIKRLDNDREFENRREKSNQEFTKRESDEVQKATRELLGILLTLEQAEAVATDEDVTLVLAGAGTGKTAVITGNIAHLVRNQGVSPQTILALAYNRKAALEVKERLPQDLKSANVSTFHSFALRVVASQGTAPTISKLAQDDFAFRKAIDGILARMMKDPKMARDIIQMVGTFSTEYREPFDFDTPREYEQYVHDAELRTLNGERVKSFEELTVANWLAANGVRYTYEKPYEFPTATREHRQYQPDFHLTDYDIYIEHFALNEQGQAPPGWTTYAQEAQWKRDLHANHGTDLIETYSWQHRKGVLESSLEAKLREHGVDFSPIPVEELVKKLSRERISRLSSLLGTFLNHAKSSDLSHDEIQERANDQKDKGRTQCFLEIFEGVREGYENLLREEDAVDFHDLINRAAEIVKEGQWESPFRYILIDEFQDISNGRMNLAEALKKPGLAYFLVGDDWQSIYRFNGSYVGLIHQVEDHLGFTRRESLTKTFRFGDGILTPSSRFVQQNPEQTKRNLEANDPERGQGIVVIPADLPETGLHQALREIEEVRDSANESILVLGRYRKSRSALGHRGGGVRNLEFNTVHSTKGQEADYVVVLDLKDERYGFPCMVEDDPILTIVMPPTHGDPYPFAEERRLLYVALTRARKAVYLITDPVKPSPFVRELLKNCPEVTVRDGMGISFLRATKGH